MRASTPATCCRFKRAALLDSGGRVARRGLVSLPRLRALACKTKSAPGFRRFAQDSGGKIRARGARIVTNLRTFLAPDLRGRSRAIPRVELLQVPIASALPSLPAPELGFRRPHRGFCHDVRGSPLVRVVGMGGLGRWGLAEPQEKGPGPPSSSASSPSNEPQAPLFVQASTAAFRADVRRTPLSDFGPEIPHLGQARLAEQTLRAHPRRAPAGSVSHVPRGVPLVHRGMVPCGLSRRDPAPLVAPRACGW